MNNFTKYKEMLSEAKDFIDKELLAKAENLGISMDEIRKFSKNPSGLEKLIQRKQEAKWKQADKEDAKKEREAKKAEPKIMTDKQFEKMCKDVRSDWKGDDEEVELHQVASDLADSMLYNPDVLAYVKKKLGNEYSKRTAREYVADSIHA